MQEERTNVPKIRFKGYAEDWEERKVGDFLKESKIKGTDGSIAKKLTVKLWRKGVIAKEEIYSGSSATQYYIRKAGQFMYGKLDFLNQAFGIVPPELDGYESTLDSPAFDIGKNMNAIFLLEYISLVRFYKYQGTIANGSRKAKRIHVDTFLEMPLLVPSFKEQQKIGTFFKQLDDTIALHQRKLDLLKQTKKSYLQKMFPKKGEDKPEIRFAGFTDAWEQRKLASMTNYKNGKGHEDKQSTIGKLELINLNSISISGGLKHSGKFIDEADDTLQKDDLVMILSDVGHGDLLGRVALIPEDDRFVLNQRVALLRPNATADPQFLFSYINAHQYYFKAQGAGMSQLNISKGSVENFISFVPIIEEQKKIGTFFKQLDDTIALHQRELDSLKEMKKSLLQQMFV
ncbi:restriction endonuclease subunit S [Enterococcus faecium]|uniref:restriction endonuclease subunit S n=1 Tax=Enterococcus faecium TaxID=1352 RepID=UPI0023A9BC0E|nr:restriction endonuclease subunit S [Enterococcus faecium]MDE5173504.1 restriction endonuclease subunit S [Enterococcus faecium]